MANLFRRNRPTMVRRNPFDLSHDVKLTTDFGRLTPILCKEVLPNDTFRLKSEMLIRTAPLFAPLMHRVNAYVHYFFVPSRLVMKNWETFITGGENGDDTILDRYGEKRTLIEKPFVTFRALSAWFADKNSKRNVLGESSLFDYLGYPALSESQIEHLASMGGIDQQTKVSAQHIDLLPFKVYQLIYNEYYRDENIEDEVDIMSDVDGDLFAYIGNHDEYEDQNAKIINQLFSLHQRNYEKDYFTSALPWPQRGGDVVLGDDDWNIDINGSGSVSVRQSGTSYSVAAADIASKLSADLNGGSLVSINELRRAIAVQKFKEKSARYGHRLTEFLRGFFGVAPADATLQRPQFLGGYKQQIQFGEVLQTSQTTDGDNGSPQGTYAGTGFSLSGGKYIKYHANEHGYIMAILSVMPKPAYMQGWPREFDRFDKTEYFVPEFDHLGEQQIDKKELVFVPYTDAPATQGADFLNNQEYGYIPRYSEYRYSPSRVCGAMRSTLDFWHLGRKLAEGQSLNRSMLEVKPIEMDRVFNVPGNQGDSRFDHLWLQVYHDIKAIRPMSKFGTPLL